MSNEIKKKVVARNGEGAEIVALKTGKPLEHSPKKLTGNALKLHDEEMKLINSGELGLRRLAAARSFDIQEILPGVPEEDANKFGALYVAHKLHAVSGQFTETTRAEVNRLKLRDKAVLVAVEDDEVIDISIDDDEG